MSTLSGGASVEVEREEAVSPALLTLPGHEDLARLVVRAARDRRYLAFWLVSFKPVDLCAQLRCDRRQLQKLRLCGSPRAARWGRDVDAIAAAIRLDRGKLAAILRAAEAVSTQSYAPMTLGLLAWSLGRLLVPTQESVPCGRLRTPARALRRRPRGVSMCRRSLSLGR